MPEYVYRPSNFLCKIKLPSLATMPSGHHATSATMPSLATMPYLVIMHNPAQAVTSRTDSLITVKACIGT